MNRTTLVLVLAAVTASVALVVFKRTTRANRPEVVATDDEREGDGSSPARTSRTGGPPPVLVLPVPVPGQYPEPAAAPAEPEGKSPAQIGAELEAAFRAARPDEAASVRMQTGVTGAFRDDMANGARLRDVECRGVRCRLSVDFDDEAANNRVMTEMFRMLAGAGVDTQGLAFVIPTRSVDGDGKVNAIVHLYRVPMPEAAPAL